MCYAEIHLFNLPENTPALPNLLFRPAGHLFASRPRNLYILLLCLFMYVCNSGSREAAYATATPARNFIGEAEYSCSCVFIAPGRPQLSLCSSMEICLHRHSTLQNAVSPLKQYGHISKIFHVCMYNQWKGREEKGTEEIKFSLPAWT